MRLRLYSVIAFAPNAPAIAEATAITIFRIISHTDFLIAIVSHLLSCSFLDDFKHDPPWWRYNAPLLS